MADSYDVFLSYRKEGGSGNHEQIVDYLERQDFRVFTDKELLGGAEWQAGIRQVIDGALAGIVCYEPSGLGRWQKQEQALLITAATERGLRLIPLLLPGASSRVVEGFAPNYQVINCSEGVTKAKLDEVRQALAEQIRDKYPVGGLISDFEIGHCRHRPEGGAEMAVEAERREAEILAVVAERLGG